MDTPSTFAGALDNRQTIIERVAQLREKGIKAVSVNTYLRCINAYLDWLHLHHGQPLLKIPRLKEEQLVLATFQRLT